MVSFTPPHPLPTSPYPFLTPSLHSLTFFTPSPHPLPLPTTLLPSCQIKSAPALAPGGHGGQQLTGTKPGSEYPAACACPMPGCAGGWGWGGTAGPWAAPPSVDPILDAPLAGGLPRTSRQVLVCLPAHEELWNRADRMQLGGPTGARTSGHWAGLGDSHV